MAVHRSLESHTTLYLGPSNIPSLADLPRRERMRILRRAARQYVPIGQRIRKAWPVGVIGAAIFVFGWRLNHSSPWAELLWGALAGAVTAVIANHIVIRMTLPYIDGVKRAWLAERRPT